VEHHYRASGLVLCGKHDIQKMDVERQVSPNPDIPGEIPE